MVGVILVVVGVFVLVVVAVVAVAAGCGGDVVILSQNTTIDLCLLLSRDLCT